MRFAHELGEAAEGHVDLVLEQGGAGGSAAENSIAAVEHHAIDAGLGEVVGYERAGYPCAHDGYGGFNRAI